MHCILVISGCTFDVLKIVEFTDRYLAHEDAHVTKTTRLVSLFWKSSRET